METLAIVIGWVVALFLLFLEGLIIWLIVKGEIDLKYVISEKDGNASLSRFQFLVFTFVVAASFLLVVVGATPAAFPVVPAGVFVLLGISGGSYLISKGIQNTKEAKPEGAKPTKPEGESKAGIAASDAGAPQASG